MRSIGISDQTFYTPPARRSGFRQKLEAARKLDHLGLNAVEIPRLSQDEADMLLMRSLCGVVKRSVLACQTGFSKESVERAWEAVKGANHPRLIVSVPVSSAQMEYVCHLKPPKVIDMIAACVQEAKALCADVEFACEDMTRAEKDFAMKAVKAALDAGAERITLCDSAGLSLPEEMAALVKEVKQLVGEKAVLSVRCGNELGLAAACTLSALQAGADEIKTAYEDETALNAGIVAHILRYRGADLALESTLDGTRINRTATELNSLLNAVPGKATPFDGHTFPDAQKGILSAHADGDALSDAVKALGYDLNEEDMAHVQEAMEREGKGRALNRAELEAIILSVAQQVPPTFRLNSYLINSGTAIIPTAHIVLEKAGQMLSGLCAGDGPIDAAFLAMEQIVGQHYELDDFQIASITQNREAMGEALVRLRHGGKIYAGKGISTDIIGAAIRAYLNALNKIAYEEKMV